MGSLFGVITEVFFNPEKGMEKAAGLGWKKSLAALFVVLLLIYLPTARKMLPGASIFVLGLLFAIKFVLNFVLLLFYSFTIHGLANLFYINGGGVKRLLSALCFTYLPFCLVPVAELLPVFQGNILAQLFLCLGLFFWMGCLAAQAVKEVYRINIWQANLLLSLPTLAVLAAGVLIIVYLVTLAGHFL